MSSLLKNASKRADAAVANGKNKGKGKGLPVSDIVSAEQDMAMEVDVEESEEDIAEEEESGKKQKSGKGKQVAKTTGAAEKGKPRKDKVLLLSSRNTTGRMRHFMLDLQALLPHTKKDAKLDSRSNLYLLNELADLHSCNNSIFLEARRHEDLYMWIARTPNGPSVKCHVQNIHTMDELKMTGNCLKGSRGIVCFDGGWDQDEHWRLLKEMITHTFSVPKTSRKLKPFIDHILTFSLLDNKIWFRNFQIVEKDPLKPSGPPQTSLVEIGPRFVLTPIRIFEGSFGGPTVFENPEFISPAATRASIKRVQGQKYRRRQEVLSDKAERIAQQQEDLGEDELARDQVFA
ncbi:Ribosome biogenesis protein brx1 [Naganishia albida]|nr:Ribosome biogenesis protein brx1 [Naganishia albida]